MKKVPFKKNKIAEIPRKNGVYLFYSSDNTILYIGKATDLRSRISSYKLNTITGKTLKLVNKINYLSYFQVNSEIEALLLETKLVKKFKPKYNIQLKDDKHPLYIRITNEAFPRVITARRQDEIIKGDDIYGPFPSSLNVRSVLRILRKIFPYSQHETKKGRSCFYNQIGLCNPCPNKIDQKKDKHLVRKYRYNIKMIRGVLDNRFDFVKKDLQKRMDNLSNSEKYERAQTIKRKLDIINYITQPQIPPNSFIKNPNFLEDIREKEYEELMILLSKYIKIKKFIRIECYDIAHLQGSEPTASMVTFINGEPDKDLYRRFKIKQKKGNDDVSSLSEVAKRRQKHLSDWGVPDLIIVDGGKGQTKVFNDIFSKHDIPVIGLAKKFESLVVPIELARSNYVVKKVPKGNALNLLKRIRDEAHRFARSYHHKLLEKLLIPDK